jgi:hypothetical protein
MYDMRFFGQESRNLLLIVLKSSAKGEEEEEGRDF